MIISFNQYKNSIAFGNIYTYNHYTSISICIAFFFLKKQDVEEMNHYNALSFSDFYSIFKL